MKLGYALIISLLLHLLLLGVYSFYFQFNKKVYFEAQVIPVEIKRIKVKKPEIEKKVAKPDLPEEDIKKTDIQEDESPIKDEVRKEKSLLELKKEIFRKELENIDIDSQILSKKKKDVFAELRKKLEELESDKEKNPSSVIKENEKPEQETVKKEVHENLEKIKPEILESGVKIEVNEFPYQWYIKIIYNKIYQNWSIPSEYLSFSRPRPVVIQLIIDQEGVIKRIVQKSSSGIEKIDRSAKFAVSSLKAIPPLPDDYKKETIEFIVTFNVENKLD